MLFVKLCSYYANELLNSKNGNTVNAVEKNSLKF